MRKDIVKLVQSTMDYMEDNLKSELDMQELSSRAGYSYFHYCQLFAQITGLSVKQYLVCRRLKHAIYEISTGTQKQALPYVVLSIQFLCVAYFLEKEQFKELAKVNEQMLVRLIECKDKLLFG